MSIKPRTQPVTPGPARGVLDRLRSVGGWLWPSWSRPSQAQQDLQNEKVRSGPADIVLPWIAPYIDNYTEETPRIRAAYRLMLRDPNVKAAFLTKLLSVASLSLKVQPADKNNARDQEIARFVKWNFEKRIQGGVPEMIWNILSGGLVDGYSVSEKVWVLETAGPWKGKIALSDLKPKDTGRDVILETDQFRNVVGVKGLRYNPGTIFYPSDFLIFRHLPLFGSPVGMADFRAAYGPWWRLDTALKLRAVSMEKRAIPMLFGRYANPSHKPTLDRALSDAKSQVWISAPVGCQIDVLNLAESADAVFQAAIADAQKDIFVAICGAMLHSLEGTIPGGRGNSEVHDATADLRAWHLATAVCSLLNDRDNGLVRDIVDLNYAGVHDYPTFTLSAVNVAELLRELQLDEGLLRMGLELSKEELYEKYGRTPPRDLSDTLRQSSGTDTIKNLLDDKVNPFSERCRCHEMFAEHRYAFTGFGNSHQSVRASGRLPG